MTRDSNTAGAAQQGVDGAAVGLGLGAPAQQHADFIQRHVEPARLADQRQLLGVFGPVDAVVVAAARGRGQQAFALVIANGVGRGAGGLGEFADLHAPIVST